MAIAFTTLLVNWLCIAADPHEADVSSNLQWANHILERYEHARGPSKAVALSAVDDYFGALPFAKRAPRIGALVNTGGFIETAGKGGHWRYSRKAGIAAASTCCEYQGDLVAYASPPPESLPDANLSVVRSKRGLHLGMTPREVVAILHVPITFVSGLPSGLQVLLVSRPYPNGYASFEGRVVFQKGHAVQIELGIAHG